MRYDIAIIGGGMVGAALAAALKQSDLRIAVIDATPLNVTDDPRLIALNHNSCCFFKNLAIWPDLETDAAAIEEVHVSTQGRFGITRLCASEFHLSELGYVIPAKTINHALQLQLNHIKHVDVIRPATLKHIEQHDDIATLTLESNGTVEHIEALRVIAADGTHSTVRALLQIPTEVIDYQQQAIVTITELHRSHHHIAYERFHASGAIAMLPLTGHRAATIWSDDNSQIAELMQLSDEAFLARLQDQFGYRLGRLVRIQKRHVFPLKFTLAKQAVKDNVILIGNAAHTIHPIAAQGLNLALYEAALLAEHFATSLSFPDSFQDQKKQFSGTILNLSHRLTQLFTTDFFYSEYRTPIGHGGSGCVLKRQESICETGHGQNRLSPGIAARKYYCKLTEIPLKWSQTYY